MRAILFQLAYYSVSIVYALMCFIAALLPGRWLLSRLIQAYSLTMVGVMRVFGGIQIEVRGQAHLPQGPALIGAKHQSWGDGYVMSALIPDLGFVCGDHLARIPLIGHILRKLGAVVVNNCGGDHARATMDDAITRFAREERHLLIYPEGHLSAVGESHRYRKGIWHLYQALNRPCVPVATNLGLAWPQQSWTKYPGKVVVEFLDPIAPGLDKDSFMAELETRIETRTRALIEEGLGQTRYARHYGHLRQDQTRPSRPLIEGDWA
ncbi:lysophospholipid acyltransferase family protein [Woodsholea maritima]|uniref:lysophospholipid acyltransferase family protein n=1 Tax=Woodsholea maritima TaxID=240237 RepID=UPI00035CDF2C|nr:lysophospholipid acyltransferase family protein [Woodsholea maritima]